MTIEEKIKELTTSLAKSEKDGGRNHLWSSFASERRSINDFQYNSQHMYLDTLARLINTKVETCVALCYCKNENKLLIASNRSSPTQAKLHLNALQEFIITDNSLSSYWKLIEKATDKTKTFIEMNSSKREMENDSTQSLKKVEDKNALKSFEEWMKGYQWMEKSSLKEEEINKMQSLVKEVLEEAKSGQKSSYWWEILLPLEDLNIITDAIVKDKLDRGLINAIKDNNQIEYIDGVSNLHAEMKIISELLNKGGQFSSQYYIGISKLACAPCWLAIKSLNEKEFSNSSLIVCGTHGSIYDKWIVPNNFSFEVKEEIYEALNSCRHKKAWESTSEIKEVQDLIGHCYKEIFQSQTQIPPK